VDEAFEEILLKALTRTPEERYQSAQEFGDALTGYLFARQLKVTNYDIANLVNSAISDDAPPVVKDETSLINRLIQEEIDESVAVKPDHLLRTSSSRPANGRDAHHEGDLEDPESWFKDDADTERMSVPPSMRPVSTPAKTGWHETGVEYEPELLEDAPLSSPAPSAESGMTPASTPGRLPRASRCGRATQSRPGCVHPPACPPSPSRSSQPPCPTSSASRRAAAASTCDSAADRRAGAGHRAAGQEL